MGSELFAADGAAGNCSLCAAIKVLRGFALYEVLLGLAIFVIGVLSLGRAVENCLNASALSEEENRVRQLLANRMAEVQASPVHPDAKKENEGRHRLRSR